MMDVLKKFDAWYHTPDGEGGTIGENWRTAIICLAFVLIINAACYVLLK